MINKKMLSFATIGMLSLGLVGCGDKSDKNKDSDKHDDNDKQEVKVDALKYTEDPKKLVDEFNKTYKGYQVSKVELNDNDNHPVYEVKGINQDNEVKLTLNTSNISKIVSKEKELLDKDDNRETINLKDVKVSPKDAMNTAKNNKEISSNPTEWKLTVDNKKTIYKVEFEKQDKEVLVNAQNGKLLKVVDD